MSKQPLEPRFWERKTLAQMNDAEWEALCDGCGKCCLNKVIDDDTDDLYFTDIACQLLNPKSCQCSRYEKRFKYVPDCVKVTLDDIESFHWLPPSCAYRRLLEGEALPEWHPLLTGSQSEMHKRNQSVRGKVVSELDGYDLQDRIVTWPLNIS